MLQLFSYTTFASSVSLIAQLPSISIHDWNIHVIFGKRLDPVIRIIHWKKRGKAAFILVLFVSPV